MSNRLYILLAGLLFLTTFGLTGVIVLPISVICFLAGFLYIVYQTGLEKSAKLETKLADGLKKFKFPTGIEQLLKNGKRQKEQNQYVQVHSMSNSPQIDLVLEQILDNITRDYIGFWYKNLSNDSLFEHSLKRTSRRSIASLTQCLRQVEWVPLITRDVVDDFASHLRLFRKAKERTAFQIKEDDKKRTPEDLEAELLSNFFDFELEMEKNLCRDLLSTTPHYENAYLHDLVDIILYLVMPPEDFRCRPLRFLLREVVVRKVILPTLDYLSNPNEIFQLIVWLLSEVEPKPDDFLACLSSSTCIEELEAVYRSIIDEKTVMRGKDSGGEQDTFVKQQLASLQFVEQLVQRRIDFLGSKESAFFSKFGDDGDQLVQLPLHVILTNSTALSQFCEFLKSAGGQNYIDFYLAIEGFKVSVEHQMRSLSKGELTESDAYETVKEAAKYMYDQYLSEEAITRVPLDDVLISKFLQRLKNDEPHDLWFEAIQEKVFDVLKTDDHFFPAFKKSSSYVKMLLELEIIDEDRNDPTMSECDSVTSFSSQERSEDESRCESALRKLSLEMDQSAPLEGEPVMTATVETLGIGHQGKQTYALYNVRVSRCVDGIEVSSWNVIRRYSDFHTLHQVLTQKFPKLATLSFPGKKTFNNLDTQFLEKRTKALNLYLSCILQPSLLRNYPDMDRHVFDFLSQKKYANSDPLTKKLMSAMFDPIRNGVKAMGSTVMAVPDQVFEGVTKMGAGINNAAKIIINPISNSNTSNRPPVMETDRVAASLTDTEAENIPLRVLVLVVSEVFGAQGSAWLRRQLVTVIRHIVTPFGTSINKRIVDIVNWLTSEQQVGGYLHSFRKSMWPNGELAADYVEKPPEFHHRTRLLAKTLMLSSLPDELRIILGANVSYKGIDTISEAFQNKNLNRRLLYVLLERLLIKVFPSNRFEKTFAQLHSKSPRTKKM
ncbi:hypothetical protein GCK72_011945 [Caenorhabditis remanei]|uniref:Sorting nexin-13 n=1 Tax=Caenorhabditis remanei TaxID=31234 RepID=E3MKB6_CAERE|nr:hypothetical protein GCK72_011945 [Caenorhabditis remanei]EFP03945.1 hypothetical protein CRE_28750 [Caenorhabditis remanei]KAF1755495.1 hypothetical protein GCK72_011945 [Caenorhabditis remanei]